MNTVMINGVEFEYSATDADFVEKCEVELESLMRKTKNRNQFEGLKVSEGYRLMCRFVDEFFDNLFGEGTSEELFGGRNDVSEHFKAVDDFNEGLKVSRKGMNDLMNKYVQRQQASPHHQGKYTKKRNKR